MGMPRHKRMVHIKGANAHRWIFPPPSLLNAVVNSSGLKPHRTLSPIERSRSMQFSESTMSSGEYTRRICSAISADLRKSDNQHDATRTCKQLPVEPNKI